MILVISRFGFEGWIWVLIASVPDLCTIFNYNRDIKNRATMYNIEVSLATRLKIIFIHKDKTGVPPRHGVENTGGGLKMFN